MHVGCVPDQSCRSLSPCPRTTPPHYAPAGPQSHPVPIISHRLFALQPPPPPHYAPAEGPERPRSTLHCPLSTTMTFSFLHYHDDISLLYSVGDPLHSLPYLSDDPPPPCAKKHHPISPAARSAGGALSPHTCILRAAHPRPTRHLVHPRVGRDGDLIPPPQHRAAPRSRDKSKPRLSSFSVKPRSAVILSSLPACRLPARRRSLARLPTHKFHVNFYQGPCLPWHVRQRTAAARPSHRTTTYLRPSSLPRPGQSLPWVLVFQDLPGPFFRTAVFLETDGAPRKRKEQHIR